MNPSQSSQLVSAAGPHAVTKPTPSTKLNAVNIRHLVPTPKKTPKSSSSPPKVTFADTPPSDEESGPPSPRSGQIPNFGIVATGIYRSAFPSQSNIDHLEALRLKTIITLVSTPFDSPTTGFLLDSTIQHYRIPVPAHKEPHGQRIPYEDMAQILRLVTNPCNQPVLIHCNKGKHRTGCIVAAFRTLAAFNARTDWAVPPSSSSSSPSTSTSSSPTNRGSGAILSEYRRFSSPKNRALDEEFIARLSARSIYRAMGSLGQFVQPTRSPNPEDPNDLFGLIEEWSRVELGVRYVPAAGSSPSPSLPQCAGESRSNGGTAAAASSVSDRWIDDCRAYHPAGQGVDVCGGGGGGSLPGLSTGCSPVTTPCARRPGGGLCALHQGQEMERRKAARRLLEEQL